MSKHTPGPWFYDDCIRGRIVINSESASIAQMLGCNQEALGHARLIAAAPDLLEALLNALPYVEDVLADKEQLVCFKSGVVQAHANAIRAAIAKATGDAA